MSCRCRSHYRPDLGWILGVAFVGTLTRPARPAPGVHLRSVLRFASGFFPTRPRGASSRVSRRPSCVQLPSARGCYQLAPQRTCTSNPVPMPGTPPLLRYAPQLRSPTRSTPSTKGVSIARRSGGEWSTPIDSRGTGFIFAAACHLVSFSATCHRARTHKRWSDASRTHRPAGWSASGTLAACRSA